MKITKVTSLLSLTAGLVLFSACKKDKVEPTPTTPVVLTPEQNKTNLQQTGLDFMKQMDDAKNLTTIDNTVYFTDLLNTANPFDEAKPASMMPFNVLYALRNFEKTGDQELVYASLRQAKSLENDTTIEMGFNDIKGTYEWNATNQKWDKSEGDLLVLKFPSSESKTTNNASYSIEYVSYNGTVYNDDLKGNTPKKLVAKLTVDSKILLQFNFDAEYNSDGIPSLLLANLKLEGYNFNSKLVLTNALVSNNYAFTHNGNNIISMGTTIKGNFSKSNLESLTENDVETPENWKKLATSMNAYIQVLNVKLEGNGNMNGMASDLIANGGSEAVEDDAAKQVDILNKNLALKAYYVSTGVKIAHSEFYVEKDSYTYSTWENGQEVIKTQEDEYTNIRLVFDDASKADLETYFGKGFEKLEDEFTKFANDLESRYGN
jgi:hypothetical protein